MANLMEVFVKIGADTSGLESGIGKAKGLASGLGSAISTGMKVVGTAIGTATTAVGAFAASSVNVGKTFDSSMSQVAATMGKSVDEIQELRDFAQEMGATTAFSATQAADALNYMALAGYDANDSMEMLPNVLNLAAAGGMELAAASDMITDSQSALGLTFEETTELVDKMAKASSKTNTSVSQLGDAILTVGGTAKNLSGGTTELTQVLGLMADNGIKASESGTHLRNIMLSLTPTTDDAAAAMEQIGLNAYDSEGKMRPLEDVFLEMGEAMKDMSDLDQKNILSAIFNKTDLAAVNALLSTTKERWDEVETAIDDSTGAAEKMANTQLDNLNGDITLFKSALEGAQILVSDKLTPSLRDFVKFGTNGLTQISDAFKEGGLTGAMDAFGEVLSDGIGMITDKIPDAVDAGVQLLGALGQGIIDNAPAIFNVFGEIGSSLSKIGLTLMENFAQGLQEFDFGAAVGQVVDFIVQTFTGDGTSRLLSAGISIAGSLLNGIIQAAPEVARGAIDIMNALKQGIQESLPQMIPVAMNTLMEFSGTLRENVGELVNAGLDMLLSIADGIIQSLPVLIQTIPIIVINIAGIINDNAPKLIVAGIELIGKLVVGILQAVPTLIAEFPKIIQAIFAVITAINWMSLGAKIVTGIASGVQNLATKIPTALKNIGTKAVEWLKLIQWKTLGKDIIDLIAIGIKGLMNLIPNTLKSIGTLAMKVFKSINWKSLGVHLVEGIWAGISGSLQWIKDRISGWVGDVLSFIKKLFMIESPSKVMRDEVGIYLGKGVAVGIEKSLPDVEESMGELEKIATTPIEADFSTNVGGSSSSSGINFNDNSIINYEELANAIVKAFARTDFAMELDGREFGRLVRRAVTV